MSASNVQEKLDLYTLFVRRIPSGTTDQELEEHFSNYGPLRSCFVVSKKQESGGDIPGIGFVNFASKDDALKAKEESGDTKFKGRKLKIEYALKKHISKQLPQESKQEFISQLKAQDRPVERPVYSHLLLYHLPSDGTVNGLFKLAFQYIKSKESITYPYLNNATVARIQFTSREKAQEAQKALHNATFKNVQIQAYIASDLKGHRLILRNLPFKNVDEAKLYEKFKGFGKLLECIIAKNAEQQSRGFAFLQFADRESATKCITEMNGKTVNGRKIAIDWCLAKQTYESGKRESVPPEKIEDDEIESESAASDDASEPEIEMQADNASADDASANESMSGEDVDDFFDLEHDSADKYEANSNADDGNANEEESDVFFESDDENVNESSKIQPAAVPSKPTSYFSPYTVFVRNVSFDACEQDLRDTFSQFGKVGYAKLVIDKNTGIPKGTAFVNFQTQDSYDSCLAKGAESGSDGSGSLVHDESSGIHLHGRMLHVLPALDKEAAVRLPEQKIAQVEQHDKRNLYLLNEGYITPESALARKFSLTEGELKFRTQSYLDRKAKLKNLNYFVSKTRISLRNLPLSMDEKHLKQIFVDAGCKPFLLQQVKVVRSKDRKDQDGNMRSMGYAFVEVKSHEKALETLRHLNENLIDIFGKGRKPIVEFSIENRAILERRNARNMQTKEQPSVRSKRPMDASENRPKTWQNKRTEYSGGAKSNRSHQNSSNKRRKIK